MHGESSRLFRELCARKLTSSSDLYTTYTAMYTPRSNIAACSHLRATTRWKVT